MKYLRPYIIMTLMFLMLLTVPSIAQEATSQADITEIAPTMAIDTIDSSSDTLGESDKASLSVSIITIVIGLLSAFSAGGIVGIAGLAQYTNRVKDDVTTVTAIEGLTNSYPPQTKELIASIFETIQNIGELGVEVFDDIPIAEKLKDKNASLADSVG